MKSRTIGTSSLQGSRLAYGCWRIAGTWEPGDVKAEGRDRGRLAVRTAVEPLEPDGRVLDRRPEALRDREHVLLDHGRRQEDGELLLMIAHSPKGLVDLFHEQHPIGEAGQGVIPCHTGELV